MAFFAIVSDNQVIFKHILRIIKMYEKGRVHLRKKKFFKIRLSFLIKRLALYRPINVQIVEFCYLYHFSNEFNLILIGRTVRARS